MLRHHSTGSVYSDPFTPLNFLLMAPHPPLDMVHTILDSWLTVLLDITSLIPVLVLLTKIYTFRRGPGEGITGHGP